MNVLSKTELAGNESLPSAPLPPGTANLPKCSFYKLIKLLRKTPYKERRKAKPEAILAKFCN